MQRLQTVLRLALASAVFIPPLQADAFAPIPEGDAVCLRSEASANPETSRFVANLGTKLFVVGYRRPSTNRIHAALFDEQAQQIGPELTLDEPFVGTQSRVDAVRGAGDGTWLATWTGSGSPGSDNNLTSIKARLYDQFGVPLTGSFQVNTFELGIQKESDAVFLRLGGFVVAFESRGEELFVNDIRARIFDAQARPVGDDFIVNGLSEGVDPEVVALADGGFVVLYQALSATNDHLGLGVAHFGPTGNLRSERILEIFQSPIENIKTIKAERSAAGDTLHVAISLAQFGNGTDRLLVRLLNLERSGDHFLAKHTFDVDSGTPMHSASHPNLLLGPGDRKTLVWDNNPPGLGGQGHLSAQSFAFKNRPLSSAVSVEDFEFLGPGAVTLSEGRGIVVWRATEGSCNMLGRFLRLPELLFSDGFETGSTARWDVAVP